MTTKIGMRSEWESGDCLLGGELLGGLELEEEDVELCVLDACGKFSFNVMDSELLFIFESGINN